MIELFKRLFKKKHIPFSIHKEELKQYLPDKPVIVEAGVCDGVDTEDFAAHFPGASIHGFECLPHYFEVAKQRMSKYHNVTLYPFALSDVSGEANFYVSKLNGDFYGSGSLLAPKLHREVHPDISFDQQIKVISISLDDWKRRYNIARVDFLWLDLQGAELKALRGCENVLKDVKAIFTEVSLIETYEGVPLYEEVKTFLTFRGFRIVKEYLPYRDMGNVLFAK